MTVNRLFFIPILFLLISCHTPEVLQATFGIYTEDGWKEGIEGFTTLLETKEISYTFINSDNINSSAFQDQFKAIYFPGGDADDYNRKISQQGVKTIQNFIKTGGSYIGICAGAEFACEQLIWKVDYTANYPLALFEGKAMGPFDQIAKYPASGMTSISLNQNNRINIAQPKRLSILYFGGTSFHPNKDFQYSTLATYDEQNNEPAAVNFTYGLGKVALIGPHPEMAEKTTNDPTTLWLVSIIDWLLSS